MSVEGDPTSGTFYIDDLVATYPAGDEVKSQGDDHLRLIKKAIKNTFPNIDAPVTATEDELNYTDITTLGTMQASKVITADANNDVVVPSTGKFTFQSGANITLSTGSTLTGGSTAVTPAEISYLSGVTSAIQTQLGTKAPSASPTFTGTVTLPSTTSIGDVSAAELAVLNGITASTAELNILDGVTVTAADINAAVANSHPFSQGSLVSCVGGASSVTIKSSIPSTTKRITILFRTISISGTDVITLKLQDEIGGSSTTVTQRMTVTDANNPLWGGNTLSYLSLITSTANSDSLSGTLVLNKFCEANDAVYGAQGWLVTGTLRRSSSGTSYITQITGTTDMAAGRYLSSLVLDTDGTNTFDDGYSVVILE